MTYARQSFKILVLGDSVLWGQGLPAQEKIHALVAEEVERSLMGVEVSVTLLAHSGAVIGEPDTRTPEAPLQGAFAREVPFGSPTLFEQVDSALAGREQDVTINVVILNGGINDLDVTTLVNPFVVFLDNRIKNAFYFRLKTLIERVYHAFPNAIIIVAGYYPFFSGESEKAVVLGALKAMGLSPKIPWLSEAVTEFVMNLGAREFIIKRFTYFHNHATAYMRQAIVDMAKILPESSSRIHFCDPKFRAEHALGAPQTLLYGIDPDLSPQDPDDIASGRAQACAENADRLTLVRQAACLRASVGHPNPAGARHYAEAILADLHYALPGLFAN